MDPKLIPNFIRTTSTLVINYPGQNFTLTKANPNYDKAIQFLKDKNYEALRNLLSPVYEFLKYAGGRLVIKSNKVYLEGDEMPISDVLARKIREFSTEGLPFEPLVNFWKRIKNNPDKRSVDQLYTFLEQNHLPISPEGKLIAFKGVRTSSQITQEDKDSTILEYGSENVFWSEHCDINGLRLPNIIGKFVTMDRSLVDSNPGSHCSRGLHVGSYGYASTFCSNGATLEIEVDPMDVVSVPSDCNCQKMRVCKYKVLGLVRPEKAKDQIIDDWEDTIKEDESGASTDINFNFVEEKYKSIIINLLGVESNEIMLDSDFLDDLGADSLDCVELIMEAEKQFNIIIYDSEAENIKTVGDAITLIELKLSKQQEDSEEEPTDEDDDINDFGEIEDEDGNDYVDGEGELKLELTLSARQMVDKMVDYFEDNEIVSTDHATLISILNNKNSLKNKKSLMARLEKIGLNHNITILFV